MLSRCNVSDIDVVTDIGTIGTISLGILQQRKCIWIKDNFYLLQNNHNKDYNIIWIFIKTETVAHVFFCDFCKVSKNNSFYRTPPVSAFIVRRNTKHKKMKTQELKEGEFEKNVGDIGWVVLMFSCVCFSVEHRKRR